MSGKTGGGMSYANKLGDIEEIRKSNTTDGAQVKTISFLELADGDEELAKDIENKYKEMTKQTGGVLFDPSGDLIDIIKDYCAKKKGGF